MDGPKRTVGAQWLVAKVGDNCSQRVVRERTIVDVMAHVTIDVELRVILPNRVAVDLRDTLLEPLVLEEPIRDGSRESVVRDPFIERHERDDVSRVAGFVHVQPRSVDGIHPF